FHICVTTRPSSYTLSLHDALPIFPRLQVVDRLDVDLCAVGKLLLSQAQFAAAVDHQPCDSRSVVAHDPHHAGNIREHLPPLTNRDRKSTRLNSSHVKISYAVFCLK